MICWLTPSTGRLSLTHRVHPGKRPRPFREVDRPLIPPEVRHVQPSPRESFPVRRVDRPGTHRFSLARRPLRDEPTRVHGDAAFGPIRARRTWLREAGYVEVRARSTIIERWAPLQPVEQA